MKNHLASAVLSAIMLISASAQAASRIDMEGFSLTQTPTWGESTDGMQLISSENGTLRVALTDVSADHAWAGYLAPNLTQTSASYRGELQAGYQISSMTVSAKVTAVMDLAPITNLPDFAELVNVDYGVFGSTARFTGYRLDGFAPSVVDASASFSTSDVNQISSTYSSPLVGTFDIGLLVYAAAFAADTTVWYRDIYGNMQRESVQNFARVSISDIILNVEVSPVTAVPEPGTYGMLLGGLAILGFVARRRLA